MQAELIINIIRHVIEGNFKNFAVKQSVFDQWILDYDSGVKNEKYVTCIWGFINLTSVQKMDE